MTEAVSSLQPPPEAGPLSAVSRSCRSVLIGIALLSGVLNALYLTGSFYMLEVYDRVLPSGSVPTLIGLAVIATVLYVAQAIMDAIRGRLLVRAGVAVDEILSRSVYQALVRLPLRLTGSDSLQPSRDLDAVRGFVSGLGPTAFFDLPWIPLYLAICFAFHPAIGWTATLGGVLLFCVALATEIVSRRSVEDAGQANRTRYVVSECLKRNAEVVRALGMEGRLGTAWGDVNRRYRDAQQASGDLAAVMGSISKVLRLVLQSAVLTVGAYLVINQQATGGIIIASSILTSRALAPLELAIGQWRSFIGARSAYRRLAAVLRDMPAAPHRTELPVPSRSISMDKVSVGAPGGRLPIVHQASFEIGAGDGLGIIGPSGSGKSSLVRAVVGIWQPMEGEVRIDNSSLGQWDADTLGCHIGYLPQDVQLFPGTIAQNIARFDAAATSQEIVAAAEAAGVHDMIVRLPEGYGTPVGESGALLSAGQKQRIGLARALFRDPFLVVLDEPNSNLDAEGDEALGRAILGVRMRGGIALVIAHRPSVLSAVNRVMVMAEGRIQVVGSRDEVFGHVETPPSAPTVHEMMKSLQRAHAA